MVARARKIAFLLCLVAGSLPLLTLAATTYDSGTYDTGTYAGYLPIVSTNSPSNITQTAATLSGIITNIGSSSPSVRGFVYGGPSGVYTASTTDATGPFSVGSFSATIAGLGCNTAYHFAAYASSTNGIGYGNDATFTTGACSSGGGGGGVISGPLSLGYQVGVTATSSAPATTTSAVIPASQASSATQLSESQIQSIMQLLTAFGADQATIQSVTAALTGTPTIAVAAGTTPFTRDLTLGSRGSDVRALQQYLNTHGFILATAGPGSPGHETTLFGLATQYQLARFQNANGITPAAGFFGPKTRALIARLMVGTGQNRSS